jgi:hypothetical protein
VKVKLHAKDQKVRFDRGDDGTYQQGPGSPIGIATGIR